MSNDRIMFREASASIGLSASPCNTVNNEAAGSASNASRSPSRARSTVATVAVEQFPRRSQTTLGGCPNNRVRCWKSLSFDTITNP